MSKITCPKCESSEIHVIGKRNALYPLGCVYILGLPFAMLHQLQSPIDYRCTACDERFSRRTRIEKLGLCLFILVIVLTAGSIGLFAWNFIAKS